MAGAEATILEVGCQERRYRLPDDGDPRERRFWPGLKDLFPHYEPFWQRYIVPLTRLDLDGHTLLRRDLCPAEYQYWEQLGMCHYSILVHLGTALELQDGVRGADSVPQIVFGQLFFHLGVTVELVDDFLWALLRLVPSLGALREKLRWQEVQRRVGGYYRGEYQSHLTHFRESGRPVQVYLHSSTECLQGLLERLGRQGQEAYEELRKIGKDVGAYRNRCAHDPILGVLERGGAFSLPREEELKKYSRWTAVFYPEADLERKLKEDFLPAHAVTGKYLDRLSEQVDLLWSYLLKYLETALPPWKPAEPQGAAGTRGSTRFESSSSASTKVL